MNTEEVYLKAILAAVARQTFPPDELAKLVAPTANSKKQIAAYNLCDGHRTQAEITKAVSLDKGNLSRSIAKWIELGIVVRMGDGAEARPLHLYPLPPEKRKGTKNGGKSRK